MSTTTHDDTTVSIDGGPEIPLSEFEAQTDQALRRLRGEQLTFDVGLPGNQPEFGSVKIGGSLGVQRDLRYRDKVRVMVTTLDGESLADLEMTVTGVSFKVDTHGYTERIHTVST